MTSRQLFACHYCSRKDFKSQLGLKQHQERSRTCSEAAREAKARMAQDEAAMRAQLGDDLPIESDQSVDNGSHVEDISMEIVVDNDDSSSQSVAEVVMHQDDDSWGLGGYDGQNDPLAAGPGAAALAKFKDYVAHVRDHQLPFDNNEIAAIEMLDILMMHNGTAASKVLGTRGSPWLQRTMH